MAPVRSTVNRTKAGSCFCRLLSSSVVRATKHQTLFRQQANACQKPHVGNRAVSQRTFEGFSGHDERIRGLSFVSRMR